MASCTPAAPNECPQRDLLELNGGTWSLGQIVEDYDTDGGYSSSALVGKRLFICFSSDNWKQPPHVSRRDAGINWVCGIRGVFITPHKTAQ